MFLCRDRELKTLSKRYENKGMECIVIYGRRRVGKTALINEFIKDKRAIFFPALSSNAYDNLEALSRSIYSFLNPGATAFPVYPSFDAAFAEITRIASSGERLVFVIDEFPYLANADRSISSRLQHLIDHDWAGTNLFIILCGSSMSFMEKEVLSDKSPLFGRRTAQMKIEPLTYLDAARFNPDLSAEDNALVYAVTGGIPHYINKLDVKGNVRSALINNFFDTSAYMFEEPQNLLKQELREPAMYNSLIAAIANGRTRLTDIAAATQMTAPSCLKYISVLSELGIVHRIEPVIDKSKRKTIYRITDPFFRFWYRFVPSNLLSITAGTFEKNFDDAVGSYLSQYMGQTFEDMCRQYLVNYAEDLPIRISDIGSWWGNHPDRHSEAELDIVAVAPKADNAGRGRQLIIGSCKYTARPVGAEELDLIRDYASAAVNRGDECHYCIFSKSGFTAELQKLEQEGEVKLMTLEDITSSF